MPNVALEQRQADDELSVATAARICSSGAKRPEPEAEPTLGVDLADGGPRRRASRLE